MSSLAERRQHGVQALRYVEVGRVAYISFGPHPGKLVATVGVIDQKRVLVDGPCTQ
jgi:large subunit ribosomal protein L14e